MMGSNHQSLMTYMEENTLSVPSGYHQAIFSEKRVSPRQCALHLSETELYKAAVLLQNPRRLLSMEVHPNTQPSPQTNWKNGQTYIWTPDDCRNLMDSVRSHYLRSIDASLLILMVAFPFGQVPLAQAIRAAPRSRATSKVRLDRLRIESEQGWQGNVTRLSFKEMTSTVYCEKFQILLAKSASQSACWFKICSFHQWKLFWNPFQSLLKAPAECLALVFGAPPGLDWSRALRPLVLRMLLWVPQKHLVLVEREAGIQ